MYIYILYKPNGIRDLIGMFYASVRRVKRRWDKKKLMLRLVLMKISPIVPDCVDPNEQPSWEETYKVRGNNDNRAHSSLRVTPWEREDVRSFRNHWVVSLILTGHGRCAGGICAGGQDSIGELWDIIGTFLGVCTSRVVRAQACPFRAEKWFNEYRSEFLAPSTANRGYNNWMIPFYMDIRFLWCLTTPDWRRRKIVQNRT